MAKPNVEIAAVEPSHGTAVLTLPLAPATSGGTHQVSLALLLVNNESQDLIMNMVELRFDAAATTFQIPTSDTISALQPTFWQFGMEKGETGKAEAENVILEAPASTMELRLHFDGYDEPVAKAYVLEDHQNPVTAGAYLFPAVASDLETSEFWIGRSGVHGAGFVGTQLFAYDLGVAKFSPDSPLGDPHVDQGLYENNEDHRIWGKSIRAMADGTVLQFLNEVPSNPHPLTWESEEELKQEMEKQYEDNWGSYEAAGGGSGNHFLIQHGDEIVLYAHMQQNSLNDQLLSVGALVQAGESLGSAGNSGNSTSPHLHIHCVKEPPPAVPALRPILFRDMGVIARGEVLQHPLSQWTEVQGAGLPSVDCAIFPGTLPIPEPPSDHMAVDPLALLLRNDIYVRLNLPNPPPYERFVRDLRRQVRAMSTKERADARARVETYQRYLEAMQSALASRDADG